MRRWITRRWHEARRRATGFVLAMDRGVPQVEQLVGAIVQTLVEAGVATDGIAILRTRPDRADSAEPFRLADRGLAAGVTILSHDPNDRRQLAYLAASESGEAILINRALHEADLVLPVGCLWGERTPGYFGIHAGIFPTFSDAKTIQRFRSFGLRNGRAGRRRELTAEVDHVAWLLGVNFTIQVVPAAGNRLLHVLAGQPAQCAGGGRNCITRPGVCPSRAGPAWWWPPSKAGPISKHGRTSAGPCTSPGDLPKTAGRSRCVATWPPRPGRPCDRSPRRNRGRPPCGGWASGDPPTPCPPRSSPGPSIGTESIC